MPVQTRGPVRVYAAVGHQRPEPRQADLAAVGMASQQQVITVVAEPVHDRGLGGVQQPEPQVGRWIGGPGDLVVPVAADMRVVPPGDLDGHATGLEPPAPGVPVPPARPPPAPPPPAPTPAPTPPPPR